MISLSGNFNGVHGKKYKNTMTSKVFIVSIVVYASEMHQC
jgi:hypothetical protein